jgi:hypothetical protein
MFEPELQGSDPIARVKYICCSFGVSEAKKYAENEAGGALRPIDAVRQSNSSYSKPNEQQM